MTLPRCSISPATFPANKPSTLRLATGLAYPSNSRPRPTFRRSLSDLAVLFLNSALGLALMPSPAPAQQPAPIGAAVPHRYLVVYRDNSIPSETTALGTGASLGAATRIMHIHRSAGVAIVQSGPYSDDAATLAALRAQPGVEFAVHDRVVSAHSLILRPVIPPPSGRHQRSHSPHRNPTDRPTHSTIRHLLHLNPAELGRHPGRRLRGQHPRRSRPWPLGQDPRRRSPHRHPRQRRRSQPPRHRPQPRLQPLRDRPVPPHRPAQPLRRRLRPGPAGPRHLDCIPRRRSHGTRHRPHHRCRSVGHTT